MHDIIAGLIKAFNLISDPANHIRGELALDENDQPISPYKPEACKFCSLGAIQHVFTSYSDEDAAVRLLVTHMIPNRDTTISALNDLLPHDMLMVRWAKAINSIKKAYRYGEPRAA